MAFPPARGSCCYPASTQWLLAIGPIGFLIFKHFIDSALLFLFGALLALVASLLQLPEDQLKLSKWYDSSVFCAFASLSLIDVALHNALESKGKGKGIHNAQGWSVVIVRPLPAGFGPKARTQIAFAVWEGSHEEAGARKLRTGWAPLAAREAK